MEPKFKFTFGQVKAVAPEGADWDLELLCSTADEDRDGEVIEQGGWVLDAFGRNPVFLAAHQHRLGDGSSPVIGSFKNVGIGPAGLAGRVKFADTDLGREYRSLYRDGHMRAVSVGFLPILGEWRDVAEDGKSRRRYTHTRQELLEVSAVAVPSNPNALAQLRQAGILAEETAACPAWLEPADDGPADGDDLLAKALHFLDHLVARAGEGTEAEGILLRAIEFLFGRGEGIGEDESEEDGEDGGQAVPAGRATGGDERIRSSAARLKAALADGGAGDV